MFLKSFNKRIINSFYLNYVKKNIKQNKFCKVICNSFTNNINKNNVSLSQLDEAQYEIQDLDLNYVNNQENFEEIINEEKDNSKNKRNKNDFKNIHLNNIYQYISEGESQAAIKYLENIKDNKFNFGFASKLIQLFLNAKDLKIKLDAIDKILNRTNKLKKANVDNLVNNIIHNCLEEGNCFKFNNINISRKQYQYFK